MRTLQSILIALALLLLLAPVASAQQQVSEATFSWRVEPPQADPSTGLARNDTNGYFIIYAKYCYYGPGLNPNEGEVSAALAVTATPEWLTVTPPDGPRTWTPDQVVQPGENCEEFDWSLQGTIGPVAPYGEIGDVEFTITVTEGDMGTFRSVAMTESKTVKVGVKTPDDPFPDSDGGDGGGGGGGGQSEENEESPAVAPMAVLVGVLGLAALRRRRL